MPSAHENKVKTLALTTHCPHRNQVCACASSQSSITGLRTSRNIRFRCSIDGAECLAKAQSTADKNATEDPPTGSKIKKHTQPRHSGRSRSINPSSSACSSFSIAKGRIPSYKFHGKHVYNFWKDAQHQRGIWRRTTLDSYRTDKPTWERVIDVDQLAKAEGKPWAWGGADCLAPAYRRCVVHLSRGGSDAQAVREFDTQTRRFFKGRFTLA